MRKLFIACLTGLTIAVFFISSAFAQSPYQKGDKIGQVGIGYGFAGIYGTSSVPPISLGFQFGIEDKISVGGLIGYTSSTYDWGWFGNNYSWTYTYILIGARGEYHFLQNSSNMDGYAGATLGYAIASVSQPSGYSGTGYTAGASYAVFGAHLGLRYYFNPNIAIFGEVGYGVGYITAGVAFKL